jgi:TatD DNase family protein
MILVDTHAHLYAEEFEADRDEMVKRAIGEAITEMYLPNIDSASLGAMNELCEKFPRNCFPMAGLHPCSVKENFEEELKLVEAELKTNKYVGVGETGIDLYWDKTFIEEQKKAFRIQAMWALEFDLPLIIHTRNSFDVAFEIINSLEKKPRGIFHCFGGTLAEAEMIISLKTFKMGIGGVLTYKNSNLPSVLKDVAAEHLVLETDSPYLPPVPHRGKRNESAYIRVIAEKLAEVKKVSFEKIADITTQNAHEIFKVK